MNIALERFATEGVNCPKVMSTGQANLKPKNASGQKGFLLSITLSIKQQMEHKKIEYIHNIRTARQLAQSTEETVCVELFALVFFFFFKKKKEKKVIKV